MSARGWPGERKASFVIPPVPSPWNTFKMGPGRPTPWDGGLARGRAPRPLLVRQMGAQPPHKGAAHEAQGHGAGPCTSCAIPCEADGRSTASQGAAAAPYLLRSPRPKGAPKLVFLFVFRA
jgi:hypothetical protein